jgi:Putative zinc-finger of transcription factor IIIC complex
MVRNVTCPDSSEINQSIIPVGDAAATQKRIRHAAQCLSSGQKHLEDHDPDLLALPFSDAEVCPACQEAVPLDNIRRAVCGNGHIWGKQARPPMLLRFSE